MHNRLADWSTDVRNAARKVTAQALIESDPTRRAHLAEAARTLTAAADEMGTTASTDMLMGDFAAACLRYYRQPQAPLTPLADAALGLGAAVGNLQSAVHRWNGADLSPFFNPQGWNHLADAQSLVLAYVVALADLTGVTLPGLAHLTLDDLSSRAAAAATKEGRSNGA